MSPYQVVFRQFFFLHRHRSSIVSLAKMGAALEEGTGTRSADAPRGGISELVREAWPWQGARRGAQLRPGRCCGSPDGTAAWRWPWRQKVEIADAVDAAGEHCRAAPVLGIEAVQTSHCQHHAG